MSHARYHTDSATESGPARLLLRRAGSRPRGLWVVALASAALVSCASASFQRGIYDDGVVRYQVGARAGGWQRIDVDDNDLAFHHQGLGTISINSTCANYDDVPQEALMNHLLFGMRGRVYRTEEMDTLDGRGAWHVVVEAELDGVPLVLEVYLVHKDGCVYDLCRISAPAAFDAGRPDFERFARGFKVLRTNLD